MPVLLGTLESSLFDDLSNQFGIALVVGTTISVFELNRHSRHFLHSQRINNF